MAKTLLCGMFYVAMAAALVAEPDAKPNVSGTVSDSHGAKVPFAKVTAMRIASTGTAGRLPSVQADRHGKFRIQLAPGNYVIRAVAEGYPDPNALLSFDPTASFPEISVREVDVSDLQVVLGAKGAILSGTVLDEHSQKGVTGARVTIRDVSDPQAVVVLTANEEGHFQFTVPAKPLLISASHPEYAPAHQPAREVTPEEGKAFAVAISLRRK